jgi:hypothetical protein
MGQAQEVKADEIKEKEMIIDLDAELGRNKSEKAPEKTNLDD